MARERVAADCSVVFIALLTTAVLYQSEMVTSMYLATPQTEHHTVSDGDTSTIVNVTFEDVERSLRLKDAIIIDVRNFSEFSDLGHIPSAHWLPSRPPMLQ